VIEPKRPVRRSRGARAASPAPGPAPSPRQAALAVLEAVSHGAAFEAALDRVAPGLDPRDRRLAHELAAGVLRHATALDQALAPFVARGLSSVPPAVRQVLRLGAYQLLHLDRVPSHAAVTTAVDIARTIAGDRSAGFVNAVLRRVAAARGEPRDEPTDLAARYSHPGWLVDRWLARFGPAETEGLLRWNNTPGPLVVQPARWTESALVTAFRRAGVPTHPAPHAGGLVVERGRPVDLPGYAQGAFFVQDSAQSLVLRYLDFPDQGAVYDACAAPGGKSMALSRSGRMVIAGEARRDRATRLQANLRRAGAGRTHLVIADAQHPPVRSGQAVLLDAPCLGTGTIARHPDARGRVSPEGLSHLAARQADLLDAVAEVVAPGGLLGYSTCSLEPEENAEQIERFLARHPDFHREPSRAVPVELLSAAGDLELLPQRHQTDGAFAARLRRSR
jgi:16S rRNA (cytosine967-C5)-methyltransferase